MLTLGPQKPVKKHESNGALYRSQWDMIKAHQARLRFLTSILRFRVKRIRLVKPFIKLSERSV